MQRFINREVEKRKEIIVYLYIVIQIVGMKVTASSQKGKETKLTKERQEKTLRPRNLYSEMTRIPPKRNKNTGEKKERRTTATFLPFFLKFLKFHRQSVSHLDLQRHIWYTN